MLRRLLKDMIHTKWEKIESFDPRPLEYCHDVLAAVWRFGNDFSDVDRDLFWQSSAWRRATALVGLVV